jgi:hypothetical protein
MFKWMKSRPAVPPPISKGNPGRSTGGRVAFARAGYQWEEHFELLDSLAEVLASRRLVTRRGERWLTLESGLALRPQIVSIHPLDEGGVRTVTTIDVSHPSLAPAGTFEYQHSTGDNTAASAAAGLEGWAAMDLPVFQDALLQKPEHCMMLSFNGKDGDAAHPLADRRVVLGPTSRFANEPAAETGEDHEFCSCCMFTRNFEAFKPLLDGTGLQAIRFYAMRDADGTAQADCRVNGLDWELGTKALASYVAGWPRRGFEFRKQFGLIHTVQGV